MAVEQTSLRLTEIVLNPLTSFKEKALEWRQNFVETYAQSGRLYVDWLKNPVALPLTGISDIGVIDTLYILTHCLKHPKTPRTR